MWISIVGKIAHGGFGKKYFTGSAISGAISDGFNRRNTNVGVNLETNFIGSLISCSNSDTGRKKLEYGKVSWFKYP